MFFVSENGAAHQLKRLRQIESRDGPLQVLVKPCPPPKLNRRSDTEDSGTSDSRNSFGGRRGGRIVRGGASRGTGRDGDEVMEEDPSLVIKVGIIWDTISIGKVCADVVITQDCMFSESHVQNV